MNSFDSPAPSLNIQKIYFKFCHCSLPISCLTILTTWSFVGNLDFFRCESASPFLTAPVKLRVGKKNAHLSSLENR